MQVSNGVRPEPAGGVEAAGEVLACAERTLAERSVRIELRQEVTVPPMQWGRPGLAVMALRLAGKVVGLLFRAWWRHVARRPGTTDRPKFGHTVGEGIAEPARGRFMIDYGSYAQMNTGGKTFGGRSGRLVRELPTPEHDPAVADVLWLLRVLRGVTDASLTGTDTVRGAVCRRFAAHVDLERASAAVADGLAAPQVGRFEQLRALPVTVWIDGEHVRRVEYEQGVAQASMRRVLELWEFGVPVDDLDWSRLPQTVVPPHPPRSSA